MKKRLLSTLLALCMVLALLPGTAGAADYPTSGTCGENATWSYDDSTKTLTISGSGEIDYLQVGEGNSSYVPYKMQERVEVVKFSGSFTVIGDYFFSRFFNLKEITIPTSITTIGRRAFSNCESLTSITIPENVIRINANAFDGCTNLKAISVDTNNRIYASQDGMLLDKEKVSLLVCPGGKDNCVIPKSVTSISSDAFEDCSKLTELVIPDNVTYCISLYLRECTSLKKITLSGSVEHWNGISAPSSLTVAAINEGVSELHGTFSSASKLSTVYLPASLKYIGSNTFANCTSLTTINFAGTEAQWNTLVIASGNQELSLVTPIYNTPVPAPSEVPSTPDQPDKPTTPDIPDTPSTPTTPVQLTATVTDGGLGKKVSIQVQSSHWLTIQTRRAGSISISSIQAPETASGTATVSFSAPSGSIIQIWETETEMQFSNGIPTTTILRTVVKNL